MAFVFWFIASRKSHVVSPSVCIIVGLSVIIIPHVLSYINKNFLSPKILFVRYCNYLTLC